MRFYPVQETGFIQGLTFKIYIGQDIFLIYSACFMVHTDGAAPKRVYQQNVSDTVHT